MRIGLVVAALALAMPVMAQRVRVQDTLYLGNGQKARGRVEISWPSFRTATGEEVAAGRTSFNVRDGVIDVQLYPTEGAAPAGVAYTATYSMTGGVQFEETWTVRASAGPLALRDVRATSTLTVWLGQLAQGGAAVNQCLIWNGTAWAPGACASGAGASAVWGAITGTLADQADLADALAGKAAAVHTHAIGDVAALQAALDGKSNTGHGHIIANVSGLQAALDAKESAANKGQPGGYAELGPDGKVPASQVPAVGGVDWGAIGGVLANQVDLQTALDSRSLVGHTHAGTYEPANANIQAHIANMNNPHGTTAAQVGASPVGHNHDAAYAPVDDPRLSDARTPLAHAASHAAGQADAITPAVIGAMPGVAGSGVVKVVGGAPALVTGSASDCVRVDGSSGACGTGGGAGMAAQLGDFAVERSTPTVLAIGANCSPATPCNVRFGDLVYSFTTSCTATISGGSGTAFIYVTPGGTLTIGHQMTVALTGCSAEADVSAFPAESIPLYTWSATSGTWDADGGSDVRAFLSAKRIIAGTGAYVTEAPGSTTVGVDGAAYPPATGVWDAGGALSTRPAKTGTSLPSACAIGEQFFKTDAAVGQNLFLCTDTDTWTQISSGGGGGGFSPPFRRTWHVLDLFPACTGSITVIGQLGWQRIGSNFTYDCGTSVPGELLAGILIKASSSGYYAAGLLAWQTNWLDPEHGKNWTVEFEFTPDSSMESAGSFALGLMDKVSGPMDYLGLEHGFDGSTLNLVLVTNNSKKTFAALPWDTNRHVVRFERVSSSLIRARLDDGPWYNWHSDAGTDGSNDLYSVTFPTVTLRPQIWMSPGEGEKKLTIHRFEMTYGY